MFHQKISHDSIFHGRKSRPYRSGDFFLTQHGSGFGNLGLEQGSGRLILGICPTISFFFWGGGGSRQFGYTMYIQDVHVDAALQIFQQQNTIKTAGVFTAGTC